MKLKYPFQVVCIWLFFTYLPLSAQNTSNAEEPCESITKIDSASYHKHKKAYIALSTKDSIASINGKLRIQTKDSAFVFIDRPEDSAYLEHACIGKFKKYNWVLVVAIDYQQIYYYIVNAKTSTLDTLIGFPQIYNNKIIAVEEPYTDFPSRIELWTIVKNGLVKTKTFSLKYCVLDNDNNMDLTHIEDSYLLNGFLYIKNRDYSSDRWDYFKLKIE